MRTTVEPLNNGHVVTSDIVQIIWEEVSFTGRLVLVKTYDSISACSHHRMHATANVAPVCKMHTSDFIFM